MTARFRHCALLSGRLYFAERPILAPIRAFCKHVGKRKSTIRSHVPMSERVTETTDERAIVCWGIVKNGTISQPAD